MNLRFVRGISFLLKGSLQEIIRLSTVQVLQYMGLSLMEIKRILEADTLEFVIASLMDAERQADIKMDQLRQAKQKIGLARRDYEKKAAGQVKEDGLFVRQLPERVILLSETLESPSLENLWNYHRHFYGQIKEYPKFVLHIIAVSNILQWIYQAQIFLTVCN